MFASSLSAFPTPRGSRERIEIEGGKKPSCCSGEGQIHPAKTRREMDNREALTEFPSSDAGNLGLFL
jgi:hypothetical protein